MKNTISNPDALRSLSPWQITAYLKANGAVEHSEYMNKATIWLYRDKEILVPNAASFGDYPQRIADLLTDISEIENRSRSQVFEEIRNCHFDLVQIRNISPDTQDGTINLTQSVEFVALAHEMLLAAACSAASHKLSYPGKKPQDAEQFMRGVRMGQTAHGSFVLQILSPVIKKFTQQGTLLEMPPELEYENRVVPTLESGLSAMNHVAKELNEDNDIGHFINAAKHGLTTNLCDAVTGMYEKLDPEAIDITINYSANRPSHPQCSKTRIDSRYIPLIREAVMTVKANQPREENDYLARGPIINLHSENVDAGGEIIFRDLTSTKPRRLKVVLDKENYGAAAKAHGEQKFVEIIGNIILAPGAPGRMEGISHIAFFDANGDQDENILNQNT